MSSLPTLAIVERNWHRLRSPLCLLGAPGGAGGSGCDDLRCVTMHYGDWQRHGGHERRWYFGYDDDAIPFSFESIVIFMPKAGAELRLRFAWAVSRLARGGDLWLVGERRGGIGGGARRFREQFPHACKVDNARHCQLWKAEALDEPSDRAFHPRDWLTYRELTAAGLSLTLPGMPGLFSDGHADRGTEMLLGTIEQCPAEPVLDFGCGNGLIGAWLGCRWPGLKMTLSDVQWQALCCARAALGQSDNVSICASDGLDAIEPGYSAILTNPPFHQGVDRDAAATQNLIRRAPDFLVPGGELRLVANAFLPYPRLLREAFHEPDILADDGRYRVYRVQRKRHSRRK